MTTPDEIKQALRASPTIADVNATARHYAKEVAAMQQSKRQDYRTQAMQIRNLAAYLRACIAAEGRG